MSSWFSPSPYPAVDAASAAAPATRADFATPREARAEVRNDVRTEVRTDLDLGLVAGLAIAAAAILARIGTTGINLGYFLQPTGALIVLVRVPVRSVRSHMFHELYLPHQEQLHAQVPQIWRRFAARFGAGERKGPMKIRITGDHPAAETLRGYVKALGCEVLESGRESATAYWIHIELSSLGYVLVRALHGPLLQETILALGELTTKHVEWLPTFSGSERAIHISASGAHTDAIGRGLRQAVLRLKGHGTKPGSRWKWLGFISRSWKRPSTAN